MLELKNISKNYRTKKHEVIALDDINLSLPEKGLVFVVGRSGSGKSTLLNVIGGIDRHDRGSLFLNNKNFDEFKHKDYDSYRNTYVGFVFQNYNIISEFTVKENIELAVNLQNKSVSKDEINLILEKVGLSGLADRKANELSGGQMQRVSIARALIKDPKIILADEPTGNLDSKTSKQIFDLLKEVSKNRLVLVVSHEKDFADEYADRIIEMSDGKIISDDVKTNIVSSLNDEYKIYKGKLPLKYAFKLGIRGFKNKVFRMILTLFLTLMSVLFFSTTVMLITVDEEEVWLNNVLRAKLDYVVIERKGIKESNFTYGQVTNAFERYKDLSPTIVVNSGYSNYAVYDPTGDVFIYYSSDVNSYIEINEYNRDYYESKLTSNSRMPSNVNEIVISSYYAENFVEFGYREFDEILGWYGDGERIEINNIEDMIGKKLDYRNYGLGVYTIVGITEHDTSAYDIIKIPTEEFNPTSSEEFNHYGNLTSDFHEIHEHYLNYILFEKDWYKDNEHYDVEKLYKLYMKIPTDKEELQELKSSIDKDNNRLITPLDDTIDDLLSEASSMRSGLMVISIIFGLFGFLQIFNFIKLSVRRDVKEIGTLRAIGASGFDICKIYLCQSAIFASIIGVFSIILGFVGAFGVNKFLFNMYPYYLFSEVFRYDIARFNLITAIIVLIVCIVSVFLATIIPIIMASRLKPIEVMKQK